MPVDSPEPDGTGRHRRRRLRALVRWLPAALLAGLTGTAAVAVATSDAVPVNPAGDPPAAAATPVLSLRRNLEPLAALAAEDALVDGLRAFVAGQPPDTCLHVRTGDLVFDHRGDDPQSPASVQKLLTAVAALTELGADATFTTEVLASAPPADGVVHGDLFLRGGGDPLLATGEYMARERNQPQTFTDVNRIADAVVGAGVRWITGAVVGDESRYDAIRYHPLWPRRFVAQGVVGPLSALSVNDGFAHFPESGGVFGPAPDPAAYAAEVLARALRDRGVVVLGSRSGITHPDAAPVAEVESPPVSEVVEQMLTESDNNTAELLLKELGLRRSGTASSIAGAEAVAEILSAAGLDLSGVAVADGSGLATEDTVTCTVVDDVLGHEPTADVLARSLPVAGESGTLVDRFRAPEVVGRLRAKTGTLNTVTALAGVARTAGDDDARFALVVNVASTERVPFDAIAAQERLAQLLVTHPREPDLGGLRPR